jgi:hypothetical protein
MTYQLDTENAFGGDSPGLTKHWTSDGNSASHEVGISTHVIWEFTDASGLSTAVANRKDSWLLRLKPAS